MLSSHCSSAELILLLNLASSVHEAHLTMRMLDFNNIPYNMDAVFAQTGAFFGIMCITLLHRSLMVREIQRATERDSFRCELSSMENLLECVSDAVVHLHHDLRLKRQCPKLDTLLLRQRVLGGGGAQVTVARRC